MENPLEKLENIELYICFIFLAFYIIPLQESRKLMENKTVYPEWVQNYRTKGTTVKKIGVDVSMC